MQPRGKRYAWVPIGIAAALVAPSAHALDGEITSDTAAQFYDVQSPTGQTTLTRRRLTSTLGVSAYDLIDRPLDQPLAPELNFRARIRYDADYGASPAESDPTNFNRLIPGFSSEAVDLMYAYLEGRRFFKGLLGFKVGRQYVTDALGWWSFDGGEAKITTPYFLAAEVYGGLEQRGGLPLSTSRFAPDGVFRGDRAGYDPLLYPQFQPAAIAPAIGVAIESAGVSWIHGRLTYRRVYDEGNSGLTEFASGLYQPAVYSGGRISTERIGYAMEANLLKYGAVKGGFAYDLYNMRMSSIYASLDGYITRRVTASIDYDYYAPLFDGDSIWNFFLGEPMSNLGARLNVEPTDRLSVSAGGSTRVTTVDTTPIGLGSSPNIGTANYFPTNGRQFDGGANLAARYKWGEGVVGLRGAGNFGPEGDRVGADLNAERVLETRYILKGRVGVWQWDDKLRPDRNATNVGYVLGVGYRFAPRSQALLEWEHNINRLVGQNFRLVLWLTVAVTK